MKDIKALLVDCPQCHGHGRVCINPSDVIGWTAQYGACGKCSGDGKIWMNVYGVR